MDDEHDDRRDIRGNMVGVADNVAPASVNVNFTLDSDAAGISLQAQKWNRWT